MRRSAAFVLAAGVSAAGAVHAAALDECYAQASNRIEVTPCLQRAQRAASDEMLGAFLGAQRALAQLEDVTGRAGAVDKLKQSQRDFERYLQSHCQVVQASFASGTGAGQAQLACEVDLLRQRAALLRALAPETKTRD